jgi:hypothetical protein
MQNYSAGFHTIDSDLDEASLPGLSVQAAGEMLGVSPSTVRRWCVIGKLRSEKIERRQGVAIRVFVDPQTTTASDMGTPEPLRANETPYMRMTPTAAAAESSESETGAVVTQLPRALSRVTRAEQARAEMTIALISATASQIIAPFMSEFENVRGLSERQSAELRQQAELIGRLSSDLDNARESIQGLKLGNASQHAYTQWMTLVLIVGAALLSAAIAAGVTLWMAR